MNKQTPTLPFQSGQDEGMVNPLEEYILICRRRLWLIVSFMMGCAGVAAVWSYMLTPIYQSKATVVIEREGAGPLERDKYSLQDISPEYFQTHFELMKSRQVLQRTARLLDLSKQPEYQPQRSAIEDALSAMLPDAILNFLKPKERAGKTTDEEKED